MRRSYADTVRDADEAMKIISPTYRELGREKYDEMMEKKDKEIKLQKKELRLKQVEELKEILSNNSKNKRDSDTLIIYSYSLKYKGYMDKIIPWFFKALYKKYGRVHFTSFSFHDRKEKINYYNVPHDIIELNEKIHKLNWHYEFFENTEIVESEDVSIYYFRGKFNEKYKYIYNYIFDEDDDEDELKCFGNNIDNYKKNILECFKRENLKKVFNDFDSND
jgi:vacuolar-type H+-ATPase subunit H